MSNPFDNVPSTADVPEIVDKKSLTTLTTLTERFEAAISREEVVAKNQEELAGLMFETFLDDDGSLKDFAHTKRLESVMHQTTQKMEESSERVENAVKSIPSTVEAHFCDEDCNRLDKNFQSWQDFIKLHTWGFVCIGIVVGICIMGSIMVSKSATDTKHYYEQRIDELDRWHQENAEATSFGQFYHENYPKKYREWQTGRWQQDIAYRDSLIRAHSLDRLKRLYED